uniref:Plastid lipid-associated protein/fibrillin conserved domain-containing protein n=1 Tax=Oryza glumipatula TaxID=40148 RepID=A0A0D9ZX62_9ORYZ
MKYKIGLQTLTLIHSHFFPSAFPHTRGGGGGGGISLPRPVALIGVGTSLGVGGRLPHPESSRDGGVRVRRRRAAEPATAALARPHDSSAQGCRVPQEQVRGWAGKRGCVAFDGDGDGDGPVHGRVGREGAQVDSPGVPMGSSTHPPATTVARLLPITLGQVFKRIDVVSKDFGNIVDVELGGPWLLLPVEVMATLAHKFGIIGEVGICVQC